MIVLKVLPIHQIILIQNITSQVQVTTKHYSHEKPRHKHGKPVNISHCLHSNSETDSDQIYGGTTDSSTKHHFYNDELSPFDQKTVLLLQ